jgi:hypothetical protein
MSARHLTPADYLPSPRSADPAELLAERDIAVYWLLGQLAKRDIELADRERQISELYIELSAAR